MAKVLDFLHATADVLTQRGVQWSAGIALRHVVTPAELRPRGAGARPGALSRALAALQATLGLTMARADMDAEGRHG
jgi:hypothetical protein